MYIQIYRLICSFVHFMYVFKQTIQTNGSQIRKRKYNLEINKKTILVNLFLNDCIYFIGDG